MEFKHHKNVCVEYLIPPGNGGGNMSRVIKLLAELDVPCICSLPVPHQAILDLFGWMHQATNSHLTLCRCLQECPRFLLAAHILFIDTNSDMDEMSVALDSLSR